jgi:hypothetical protein
MFFGMNHSRSRCVAAANLVCLILAVCPALIGAAEPTIEELKKRVVNTSLADRPPLCIRICERQLDAADRFYVAGDSEKAGSALTDVVAFAELARDYAIQTRKHEKPSEIAIRKMARKLFDLKHTVSHEDQEQVQNAVDRLERVRDDLLLAMFPKGGKK